MSIQGNPTYYPQNSYEFEQKACYLAKCAVAVAVVKSVVSHIFGVDSIVLSTAIFFVASEIVKGVVNNVRIEGIIRHHQLMSRGNP